MSYHPTNKDLIQARVRAIAEAGGSLNKGLANLPPDAMELCNKCLRRGCPNVHACCGGRVDLVLRVPCPDGRWKMIGAE